MKKYLFADSDQRNVNLARKLVADSRLLRSNYDKYLKHWTESGGQRFHIADHEAFLCETRELFELVLERIQRETEYLYPLLRKVEGGERQAILEEVRKFNPKCSFPTIIIGNRVIVGHKEDEIKEALGL